MGHIGPNNKGFGSKYFSRLGAGVRKVFLPEDFSMSKFGFFDVEPKFLDLKSRKIFNYGLSLQNIVGFFFRPKTIKLDQFFSVTAYFSVICNFSPRPIFSCNSSSISRNVDWSVCLSVGPQPVL